MQKKPKVDLKSYILNEAYKLFLLNDIETVTISELEKTSHKMRGTIFYHFGNKQGLFEAVVRDVFLPSLSLSETLCPTYYNTSFKGFIRSYVSPANRAIQQIKEKYNIEYAEVSFFNFISQANRCYPNFQVELQRLLIKDYNLWNNILIRAKELKEVKNIDTEKYTKLFLALSMGQMFNTAYLPVFSLESNLLSEVLNDLIYAITIDTLPE